MRNFITLIISVFLLQNIVAQTTINGYEYWFNENYQEKTLSNITASEEFIFNENISTDGLTRGLNIFYFRTFDNLGNFSPLFSQVFYKNSNSEYNEEKQIVKFQYWLNSDLENVQTYTLEEQSLINLEQLFDFNNTSEGLNRLNIRFQDNNGLWSSVLTHLFYKLPIINSADDNQITHFEYWIDDDYENAILIEVEQQEIVIIDELISLSDLSQGLHKFNFRLRDRNGLWSSILTQAFYKLPIQNSADNNHITHFEYWINDDYNNVISIETEQHEIVLIDELISLSELNQGLHKFNFRFKDNNGLWSSPTSLYFYKFENSSLILNLEINTYRYWFDDDNESMQIINLESLSEDFLWSESLSLPSDMEGGNHTIYTQFRDNKNLWSSPLEHDFFKNYDPRGEIIANNLNLCFGNTIILSANTIDVDTVFWDFGDGSDIVDALPTDEISHQYNSVGEYEITCTFKHVESGNTTSEAITVVVHPIYDNLSVEEIEVCANELPYIFGNQELNESGYYEELFQSVNGCDSLAKINFAILELSYGIDEIIACKFYEWIDGETYTESTNEPIFTLTNQAGCDSVVTLNLTIIPLPNIEVIQNEISLTATETEATYQWLDCNNNFSPIANTTSQTFVATENGKYAVKIEKDGCSAISDCYEITRVGIFDNELSNISIYPNPNDGKFAIDLGKVYEDISYEIYDLQGRIILAESYKNREKIYLDLIIASGIYTIKIKSNDGIKSLKIIID